MELSGGGGRGGGGGGGGGRRRGRALSKEALLCWVLFFLLFSVFALFTRDINAHFDIRSFRTNSYTQRRLLDRRELNAGPGSYPPRCASKCGNCTPCLPVHVPVPPGTPVIAEYYPEAWRCKCGNKLYMP